MRRCWVAALGFLVGGASFAVRAEEPLDPAWQKLRSLVGEWRGTNSGNPVSVSYRLVSNATALMETLEDDHSSQMVTVYHPDGASFLMNHYCSMGNQVRMRGRRLEGDRLEFGYLDSSNLRSPDEFRMTRLVLSFLDSDHLVQEWTAKAGTQEHVSRFEFTRNK